MQLLEKTVNGIEYVLIIAHISLSDVIVLAFEKSQRQEDRWQRKSLVDRKVG